MQCRRFRTGILWSGRYLCWRVRSVLLVDYLGVDLGAAGLLQGIDLQGDRLILGADPSGGNCGRVKFTLLVDPE
jgi:hypothetical protein